VEPRFAAGAQVALREVWNGAVWAARPAVVVEDTASQTTLFCPAGIAWFASGRDGRRLKIPRPGFELMEQVWDRAHVLSFAWPGRWAAILLLYRTDWSGFTWYVNVEEPLRRTQIGFDTLDLQLDATVWSDGWRWKDEDELAEAIDRGVIDPDDEPRLRAEAERAVRRILEREPPFDREWGSWRPDPSWPVPELPEGWDRV
jgi:hypothetical protein